MNEKRWLLVAVIGLLINYVIISREARRSPEGAMGMGLVILIGLIPFSLPVLFVIGWILGKVRGY